MTKKSPATGAKGADTVLTRRALGRATLARQMLLAREETTALAAIERLVALQAQLPRPPFIGLWTRIAGFCREDLIHLIQHREVVRVTSLRGTLHVQSARDYVAMRPTLQEMLTHGMKANLKERAADLDVEGLKAAAKAFFDDEPRTFTELRNHLIGEDPTRDERAMGFAVRMHLPLVMVPTATTWGWPGTADFAAAETWLGQRIETADTNPEMLVWRYLAAFGPASVKDAQTWSGLTALQPAFERLRPQLVTFQDDKGKELFDLPDAPRPDDDTIAPVRFLPEFDNLVLSHADRRRFVADEHRKAVYLPALRVAPTILVDGVVAGTWKIERVKRTATLTITPFAGLSRQVREDLTTEGAALVRFVEADAATCEVSVLAPP